MTLIDNQNGAIWAYKKMILLLLCYAIYLFSIFYYVLKRFRRYVINLLLDALSKKKELSVGEIRLKPVDNWFYCTV